MIDECPGDGDGGVPPDEAQARAPGGGTVTPLQLFDAGRFHRSIVEVSRSLFADSHYAQAIFEAFKQVEKEVKDVSGLTREVGTRLMEDAFKGAKPKVALNRLLTESDHAEQRGFKLIFKGMIIGIRNLKAHDHIVQNDPYKTLDYLGLASLLLRRVDERVEPQGVS